MASISFQRNNKTPKTVVKKNVVRNNIINRNNNIATDKSKVKVNLIKHEGIKAVPEYFSYLNDKNEEVKFSGIIIKDVDNSYIGKQVISNKVLLTYHPAVESVKYSPEYFTYVDKNGKERSFIGEPRFDMENNTYVGTVTEEVLNDEIIEIFKEEK